MEPISVRRKVENIDALQLTDATEVALLAWLGEGSTVTEDAIEGRVVIYDAGEAWVMGKRGDWFCRTHDGEVWVEPDSAFWARFEAI